MPVTTAHRIRHDRVYLDLAGLNGNEGIVLREFEFFVYNAARKRLTRNFTSTINIILTEALQRQDTYRAATYLAMLHEAGDDTYLPVFENAARAGAWQTRRALARHIGTVKTTRARNLLVQLVSDSIGAVQAEAVRQLVRREPAAFVAPLLTRELKRATEEGLYPTLMNPALAYHAGKIEIMNTLINLRYQPALPVFLALLKTDSELVFDLALRGTMALGSRDYIPYLRQHLNHGWDNEALLRIITGVMETEKLITLQDPLMDYVDKHRHTPHAFALTTLAHIATAGDTVVEQSILGWLRDFTLRHDTAAAPVQNSWTDAYFEACTRLAIPAARPLLLKLMYQRIGLMPSVGNTALIQTGLPAMESVAIPEEGFVAIERFRQYARVCPHADDGELLPRLARVGRASTQVNAPTH